MGEPRPRLWGSDLSCDGDGRVRGPDARRALAEGAALCRSRCDRHLWLVLWRLYDAETAGKSTAGILCGGHRGRIGDALAALRHRLYRTLYGQIGREHV